MFDLYVPVHGSPACLCMQVRDFAHSNNINLLYIPAGFTSTYQPLDTHINGIIKAQLSKWTMNELSAQKEITLLGRKKQCTYLLNKLSVRVVRAAFDESLLAPAQAPGRNSVPVTVAAQQARTAIDEITSNWILSLSVRNQP